MAGSGIDSSTTSMVNMPSLLTGMMACMRQQIEFRKGEHKRHHNKEKMKNYF
jgi:hypothetical protein